MAEAKRTPACRRIPFSIISLSSAFAATTVSVMLPISVSLSGVEFGAKDGHRVVVNGVGLTLQFDA